MKKCSFVPNKRNIYHPVHVQISLILKKADVFSHFIERMWSYVALGCSSLGLNKCPSPNFNAFYLFRNGEEAGWFVLQNVPLLVLEQESTIPAQWVRTSTSPWSIRSRPPQQEVSCRPVVRFHLYYSCSPSLSHHPQKGQSSLFSWNCL